MSCKVRRVLEHDIEEVLDDIDAYGHELLRILDLPKALVNAKDCGRCSETLCQIHELAFNREGWTGAPATLGFELIVAKVPRYAVVYRLCAE